MKNENSVPIPKQSTLNYCLTPDESKTAFIVPENKRAQIPTQTGTRHFGTYTLNDVTPNRDLRSASQRKLDKDNE